jgi:hypothetical protein
VDVAVDVAVGVDVAVDVAVGVDVAVDVEVGVDVAVDVAVGVDVAVDVAVGVDVAVEVEVGVAVGVAVGVGSGRQTLSPGPGGLSHRSEQQSMWLQQVAPSGKQADAGAAFTATRAKTNAMPIFRCQTQSNLSMRCSRQQQLQPADSAVAWRRWACG